MESRKKVLFDIREFSSGNGIAGDQHQFNRLRQLMLMQPETFAEQAAGAIPFDGSANFATGNHAQFRRGAFWQAVPIGDQTALREALALLPDAREIAALLESSSATQAQAFRRFGGHGRMKYYTGVRRLRPWRRRFCRVARPALVDLRARNPC